MEPDREPSMVLKALFNLCFLVLFFEVLALAEWVLLQTMMPKSPLAALLPFLIALLVAQVVALILYFKMPLAVVAVAWLGTIYIAARAIPWGSPSWGSAVRQFQFQVIYFAVAHVAYGAYFFMNRTATEEASKVEAEAGKPPVAEK